MKKRRRIVDLRVLPGQPTDGSGQVCIHLFVPDERGPFTEPCVTYLQDVSPQEGGGKRLSVRATKGRLACDRKRLVAPVTKNGVTSVTVRTDDPRAATCYKCIASEDYKRIMRVLSGPDPAVAAQQNTGE